jgi:hypothetical protein
VAPAAHQQAEHGAAQVRVERPPRDAVPRRRRQRELGFDGHVAAQQRLHYHDDRSVGVVAPKHHHVAGDVGQAGGDASYSIGTIVVGHTVSARNTKKPIRCLKGNCEENVVRSHALLDPQKLITW